MTCPGKEGQFFRRLEQNASTRGVTSRARLEDLQGFIQRFMRTQEHEHVVGAQAKPTVEMIDRVNRWTAGVASTTLAKNEIVYDVAPRFNRRP
jgi:hypothetical protein